MDWSWSIDMAIQSILVKQPRKIRSTTYNDLKDGIGAGMTVMVTLIQMLLSLVPLSTAIHWKVDLVTDNQGQLSL